MVSFLCIRPGEEFSFALSKRTEKIDGALLGRAHEWMTAALYHLGAGAKTNAGYGVMVPVEGEPPKFESPARVEYEETLELLTPAFLAGADQKDSAGCELRPATLRGLLRWWWRTMHAGYMDCETLKELEAVVWGDTKSGGAVRITVEKVKEWTPFLYDKHEVADKQKLPAPPPNVKKTHGLFYVSFGMHDGENQRHCFLPGMQWKIRFSARKPIYGDDIEVPAELILRQAQAALWLLCHYGGIESKARNGFGSFLDIEKFDMDFCERSARDLRGACGIDESPETVHLESPSFQNVLPVLKVPTPWTDPWFALDRLGYAVQEFAQAHKHREEKKALGLPRIIGHPRIGAFTARKGGRHGILE